MREHILYRMPLRQVLAFRHCHLLGLGFTCISPAELAGRRVAARDRLRAAASVGKPQSAIP